MNIKNLFAPSVRGLVGAARRAAMMLLVTMLTTATAWAGEVTLNENTKVDVDTPERWYVNLPKTGINTLELTGEGVTVFKVYDDGGSADQYNNNCSGALTVIAPEGWVVQLSGTITSEKNCDKLTVYDGDKTSSPKIIDGLSSSSSGAETDINPVNSKGRFMTIQFTSDNLARYLGIDLTVKIYNPTAAYAITFDNPLTGGTLAACVGDESVTTAHVNDVVTLTATPESGYLLSGISIVDANNKPVDLVWDGSFKNTATFVMPVSAVTITPTFTNTWTADGGLCVNVPKKGTTTVTIPADIPSFKVYDDGGATNPYSSYCNGTLILEAPDSYLIRLSGSLRTESSFDNLIVYNGDPYGTILLDSATSATSDSWTSIPTVTSTVQSMALHFNSDGYWRCDGLNLTATLVSTSIDYDITNVIAAGGTIAVSVGSESATTAKVNEEVTLTATPESGYLLNALSVVGEDGKPVNLNWDIWTNTATFIMPPSAVTITPNFVNTWTAAGGLYINMPQSDMKTINIPTGVTSFKIYDDGGSEKPYSNNCNATITLVAPEGYVLQLSNSLMTEKYHDKLTVYDGSAWSPTLIDALSSATTGSRSDIPTVNSTGQYMTINFYSNYNGNYAGLDLTVTLVDINTAFDITNVSAAGGTLAVSVGGKSATTAKVNEEVTLTAAPESGYLLSGISVVAANGTPVSVNWEGSFKNTATFVMPASAVTITPTFTDIWTAAGGICVNMPKTGSTSVTIPAGIPSLKVYDDGGATGNYSNNCNSSITLTAPEGYVLQLSGKITTDNQGDALSVCDTYSTYISGAKSTFSDVQVSIPTVTSIDRDMTLSFYSNYNGNYDGLDLTVTLIKNVLTLEDGSDNSEAIETAAAISGKVYDVTLSGRTLYKDGSWNTLCLPFALNDFSGTPLEEAKVVTLGNSKGCNTGYANNTLNLEFLAAGKIEAGVPYLVRWTKAEGYDSADPATRDIVDPVFTGVTIENETPADRSILSGDGYVDFVGTYSPVDFTADDRSILYLGTSNALYWPGTDMTLRAFRAYFQLKKDLTAGEILSARMYFGDSESETTSLNEEFATATGATATWYTLDGRKLSGKPTKKGVYINNGKKTVVK